MGAYVGRTAVKDGKGVMVDWRYADGADYLPPDDVDAQAHAPGRLTRAACAVPDPSPVARSSSQLLNGLAGASSLFLVAAGLSLIFGVTRIVNFAHGSLMMLGAYIAYRLIGALRRAAARLLGRACCSRRSRSACSAR